MEAADPAIEAPKNGKAGRELSLILRFTPV